MGRYKEKDLKVGDYVYTSESKGFDIAKITEIEEPSGQYEDARIWGIWCNTIKLPKTFKELLVITKHTYSPLHTSINNIAGILDFTKEASMDILPIKVTREDEIAHLENLLNLDCYESSTIIALNQMLGDGYDLEGFLKVLVPNIAKITKMN